MKTFNKYQFLRDLEEAINEDLAYCYSKNMDIEEDQIHEFIHTHIENHTIYAIDAWAIAYELGENDLAVFTTNRKLELISFSLAATSRSDPHFGQ